MAGQKPGIGGRPALRAAQALTRRILPDKVGVVVERAIAVKVALAALPFVAAALGAVILILAVVGTVAGMAGAEGCSTGGSNGAAAAPPLTGPPKNLIPIYQEAADEIGLGIGGPSILAAINFVETDFGRNQGPSSAGAIGWMQFEPSTWKIYGNGGDPHNPHDAIFAAARLLKADGAPGDWENAILGYNHAQWYVDEVEKDALKFSPEVSSSAFAPRPVTKQITVNNPASAFAGCPSETSEESTVPGATAKLLPSGLVAAPADAPEEVKKMIAAANKIALLPYVWGGHHGLGAPINGYDCSSAASYVLFAGGLMPKGLAGFEKGNFWSTFVAADFEPGVAGFAPGPGHWITLYTNGGEHVYMMIAGVRFDDSSHLRNGAGPGGGNVSMWQPPIALPGFVTSHPEGL
jgi:hypothetical protein